MSSKAIITPMTRGLDIARLRLRNQYISFPLSGTPVDVVRWLGAVQSQDFAGAKWAVGSRLPEATDKEVEEAFDKGSILRTHLLRPTWHFVTREDIRWILELTAPRVSAANAYNYRKLGLDQKIFKRTHAAIAKALAGDNFLTRDELRQVLRKRGIPTDNPLTMIHIMAQAETDGLVCSGPRRGKQFTYALLEERAPKAKSLKKDEALAELAKRYFLSRGPATLQDFSKWSGLTIADARDGLESVKEKLCCEVVDGKSYWLSPAAPLDNSRSPIAHLLSVYDEYFSGYKDRSAYGGAEVREKLIALDNNLYYIVVLNGKIAGTWKRTIGPRQVEVKINIFGALKKSEMRAVAAAV